MNRKQGKILADGVGGYWKIQQSRNGTTVDRVQDIDQASVFPPGSNTVSIRTEIQKAGGGMAKEVVVDVEVKVRPVDHKPTTKLVVGRVVDISHKAKHDDSMKDLMVRLADCDANFVPVVHPEIVSNLFVDGMFIHEVVE